MAAKTADVALKDVALTNCGAASCGLPRVERPEDAGLSSQRLERLTEALQADVRQGAVPGAVVLVARHGQVAYCQAVGFRDRQKGSAMTGDAIFRIASMTKPFTSVAAMMLAEEGKIHLAASVSQYLPEFKDLKVGIEKTNAAGQPQLALEPPRREMTVQDLLRHTSGLTYGMFGSSLVKQAYNDARVFDPEQTNAEMAAKLAALPLAYQPGTTWEYSMSTDVLGRVVEVASGMDLGRFIEERIAQPLGLADTGFSVAAGNARRIAEPQPGRGAGHSVPMSDPLQRPKWLAGGHGMVSTAADYARFCQMLLNGGQLEGVRLLSPKTVALMTSDHLPPGVGYGPITSVQFGASAPLPEMGQGFGLGLAVRKEQGRNPLPGSVGDYFWGGVFGTYFWIDPKEQILAILMLQAPTERLRYRSLTRQLIYQAVIE